MNRRRKSGFHALLLGLAWALVAPWATGQVSVQMPVGDVRVRAGDVSVVVGSDAARVVDMDAGDIRVINGEVWIDGDKVPKGRAEHLSRKTGKRYRIDWGRDGNVAVFEK